MGKIKEYLSQGDVREKLKSVGYSEFEIKIIEKKLEARRDLEEVSPKLICAALIKWSKECSPETHNKFARIIPVNATSCRVKLTWRGLQWAGLRDAIGPSIQRELRLDGYYDIIHRIDNEKDTIAGKKTIVIKARHRENGIEIIYNYYCDEKDSTAESLEKAYRGFYRDNYSPGFVNELMSYEEEYYSPQGIFDYSPKTDKGPKTKSGKNNDIKSKYIGLKTLDKISKQIIEMLKNGTITEEELKAVWEYEGIEKLKEVKGNKRHEVLRKLAIQAQVRVYDLSDPTLQKSKAAMLEAADKPEEKERQRIFNEIYKIVKKWDDEKISKIFLECTKGFSSDYIRWGDLKISEAAEALKIIEKK